MLPGGGSFRLRAGVGWQEGSVGNEGWDGAGPGFQAGFTLQSGEPVVVADLRAETRFEMEPMLAEHGVVSGATVKISGHQ